MDMPFFITTQGEIYGFVTPEGEIYLDENVISPEHPIHEYTHLWDRAVAKKNPKLWKKGVELMKKTDLWEEILFDKNYGKKWTSNPNITPEELEFLVASEVHARIVGERGQQVLERIAKQKGGDSIVSKLKEWAFQFWKTIAQTFSPWTQEQIDRLSYGDFVNIVLRDFAQDENVLEIDENGEMSARDVICADPFYGRSVTSSQQTRCIISKLQQHFGDLIQYNDKTKSFYLYYQNHPSFRKQNALTEVQLIDQVIQYCKYFFDKIPIIRRVGSVLNPNTGKFEPHQQPAILGFAPNKSIFDNWIDKEMTLYDNKCLIEQFLEQRFPETQVRWITREEQASHNSNANAWYDIEKNCVCLVMDAVKSDNIIEEFLHPITLMMQCSSPSVFDDLYDQAVEKYPEIRKQVDKLYGNEDEFVKRNEVVTKALSKVLDKKEKNKNRISVTESIFKDIIDHISRISNGKHQIDVNKLPDMTLDQFVQLICCEDVQFLTKDAAQYIDEVKQKRLYNIANTLDPNEIHERLTDAMESLHRQLSSKKRTSITDTRRKQIHETLNKIRTADTIVLMNDFLGQAIESLGIPNETDNTIPKDYTPNDLDSHPQSVWGALLKAKENNYANVDPMFLMDEFRFSIGFYEQTMKLLESFIHNTGILEQYMSDQQAGEIREQADNLNKILRTVKSLWRDAVFTVGDQIVDNSIDEFVTAEKQDKESMKIVYKDWLHRNLYYGDINLAQKLAANYGRHQNGIVKMAFTLIGEANTKTQLRSYNEAVEIDKAFSRCNNAIRKSLPFSWQDMFMERDRKGRYTGKFARKLNFGQYDQDLDQFVSELNNKFDQDYGYHYVYNASGDLVRSDNQQLAEDEPWGDSMTSDDCPVCIKYLNEINKWKGIHCHRRYTANYYGEMLSRPITATHKQAGEPYVDLPHGLSPKTYFKYNRLQEDINYILNDCTDQDTGFARPESLEPEDKLRLDRLQKELRDLSNPFEDDGSLKEDEKYQIAIELCSWQTWIGKKLNTKVDIQAFEDECSKLSGQELEDFVKYNSYWGVHPQYSEQIPYANIPQDIRVHEMDLRKSALLRMPSTTRDLFRELYQYRFSGEFWKNCRDCDQYIADNKLRQNLTTHDRFADRFYRELVPYIDEYGNYRTVTGQVMTPQQYGALVKQYREHHDDSSKPLVVLPELYSFKDYITDLYVQEALQNGTIPGFNDNDNVPVSFSGMSENDIRMRVEQLFTYVYNYTDYDGTPRSETRPLSVFVTNQPSHNVFLSADKDNNVNVDPVVINVPIGRFSTKVDNGNNLVDGEFDPQLRESEQPVRFDADGNLLYDNSKAFSKLGEIGTPDRDLYELLVDTMRKKYLQAHPNATRYDYRLPQINASNSQILSRALRIGIKDAFSSVIESIYAVQENDTDMRTEESYIINPDGSKSLTLPRRFDSLLEDPQHISKDVVAGVKMYLYMSNNYKDMQDIEAQLNMLEYNMRDDIRQTPLNHSEYGFKSAERSDEVMKRMINTHVYEDQSAWGADTPMKVAISKIHKQVSKYLVLQLLAFNVMSVATGFVDQMSRLLTVAFSGKLFSPIDFMYGLGSTIYHTPAMIWNMGKSYNKQGDKLVGTMAALGIGADYKEIVEYTSKSQLRNVVVNSALGAYSMMDYYGSSTALVAMMRQRKFYDGGVVPAGFYTSYELQNKLKDAGMSPMEARIHAYRSRLMSHTTMWGAVKIEPGGKFVVKPKWQQYIKTKDISQLRKSALQQGALFAGTNPKNDKPFININALGMALTGMRGWLQQSLQWQGLLDGIQDDTSVREFEEKEEEVIRHGKTTKKVKLKRKGRTPEQKYRRFSWNFEMGMPDDNVLTNVVRSIPRVIRSFCDLVTFNLGKASKRISYSERKAWRALIMYVASIVLIGQTISPLVDWANTAPAPPAYSTAKKLKSYQTHDAEYAREQSAAFMPWEDEYYDYQIYKLQVATIAMRTYQNKMDGISPIAAMDVIKQAAVTYSGYDRAQTAATEWLLWKTGILPDEEGEIIKQGSYKNFSKGERDIQMLVPGLRNIHTSFSHYGVQNNLRWYLQTFGNPEFKDVKINDNRPVEKKAKNKKKKTSKEMNFDNDMNFDNNMNFNNDMNFDNDMSFD